MSWGELVSRAKSTPSFASEVKAARRKCLAKAPAEAVTWVLESLVEDKCVQYLISQKFLVLTPEEFEKEFGKEDKFPNLKHQWQELENEYGGDQASVIAATSTGAMALMYFSDLVRATS